MRVRILVAAIVVGAAASTAGAQGAISANCPAGTVQQVVTRDACQKAIDLFQFMAPQLGIAMTGGNATLGQGGALGGIGRFSVGLRGNVLRGRVPQVENVTPSITGAVSSDYEVDEKPLGLPAVEAAIGIFKGLPVGVTNILAVDALVSAYYVPEVDENNLEISVPSGSVRFGFGGRVGLLQESFLTPSVAVSYLRRDLPTTNLLARSGTDELSIRSFEIETTAWRVVAGKNLGIIGLSAGGGQDRYDSQGTVAVEVNRGTLTTTAGPFTIDQKLTRTNYFADVSLNLPIVKIAAEIGRVSGGEIATFNTFSGKRADDALTYASLGFRIGF